MFKKILQKFNLQFSWYRLYAVLIKEFIQIKRDRVTFAMIVAIPLLQLVLFGFAINTNPKKMPAVVIANDHSEFTRTFIAGLKNTDYFTIEENVTKESEAKRMLATGKTQFVFTIPSDFTRKVLRHEESQILLEADATDPVATGSAINAVGRLAQTVFNPLLQGSLGYLKNCPQSIDGSLVDGCDFPINIVTHSKYNPEGISSYNIVPGLLGVILTMTMVMVAGMGMTRERENGTMEHLLSTPVRPLEVMLGKLSPYVIVGYMQMFLILIAAKFLFGVPFFGNVFLLLLAALPFIVASLSVGLTFASMAKSQLQTAQMSTFFFLPSILLSGFMFPFRGMPFWAQKVGSILPLTYFLRITRGVILKGNGVLEILPDLWPIVLFMVVAIMVALKRYRETLD